MRFRAGAAPPAAARHGAIRALLCGQNRLLRARGATTKLVLDQFDKTKMISVTKTGSGQTQGKHSKRNAVSLAGRQDSADVSARRVDTDDVQGRD